MNRTRLIAIIAALVVIIGVGAVVVSSGDSKDNKSKSTTTTAKGVLPETNDGSGQAQSSAVPPHAGVLNGLEEADGGVHARPPLVVKIDNAPKARPQYGIGVADVVVEEGVEGGITRFAAIFHSQDAPLVGPVRSARSSDLHIAGPLGRPLFAYSGTNSHFQALIDQSPLINLSPNRLPGAYHRDGRDGRSAPYNLFSTTSALFAAAPKDAIGPKKLFDIGGTAAAATGAPAHQLDLHWADKVRTDVSWSWDGTNWSRVQNGTPTIDANGPGVHPRNIVVLFTNYEDTGERDQSNSVVPEAKLSGTGEAWIIREGTLIKGTWTKSSDTEPIALSDSRGARIALLPGQTWVELPKPGDATVG